MSSTSDRIIGVANELAGKAKQSLGQALGDRRLEAEGAAQELKGVTQKALGDARAAVKRKVDSL